MRRYVFTSLLAVLVMSLVTVGAQTRNDSGRNKSNGIQFSNIDYPGPVSNWGAYGIDADGDIVGQYGTPDGVGHSFVKSRGTFKTLDFSDEFPGRSIWNTWLQGITPGGDTIVGTVVTEGVCNGCPAWMSGDFHGVVWTKRHVTTFKVPNAAYTIGYGINPRGDIVGEYMIAGLAHGFLLRAGTFKTIDIPNYPWSSAEGINAGGDIVGWYGGTDLTNPDFHGYVLRGKNVTAITGPGSKWTIAYGINARGDVVGMYMAGGASHGFLWRDGNLTTVDIPGAVATQLYGINDDGDIVGWYSDGSASHGVLLPDFVSQHREGCDRDEAQR